MDFYKYLIGFGPGKKYCKLQFPTGNSSLSDDYKGSLSLSWEALFTGSKNSVYYYCLGGSVQTNNTIATYPDGDKGIQLLVGNDRKTALNLGNILLSGSEEVNLVQEVWGPLYLNEGLYANRVIGLKNTNNEFTFSNIGTITASGAAISASSITLTSNEIALQCINGSVEATYFNATSDRRAKTNICEYKGNATELVKKIPIYTFNYLVNNSSSIGMIAQEAAIFDNVIPNFSLVNNEEATGKDGDYMSIKESKLVYILWKAVQEQAEKIEKLQEEITKIRRKIE